MPYNYNIEMDEPQENRRWSLVFVVVLLAALALALFVGGTQATYTKADEASHVYVLTEGHDIKVGLTESAWSVNKGLDQMPGSCLEKNPTIENEASDCYMRVNFRLTEKEEGKIGTDTLKSVTIDPTSSEKARQRCAQILKMIWSDTGSNIEEGTSYTYSDLASLPSAQVNNVFNNACFEAQFPNADVALNGWNSEMKAYSFLYKNAATNNVFKEGESATIFTHLIVPADLTDDEFYLAGDYYINIWVQAIQTSKDFETRSDAIAALSNADVDNDLSQIDGEEVNANSKHRRL